MLSRLKKVDLRKAWVHEAYDFTKWLAEEENLEVLSNAINIEISLIDTEANVGRFSVDILAEEVNTGEKIIIENQLEKTDHDHLGKIITYASGLEANIIVWIVKEALEEHQKAISWLNENTDSEISFFLIQIEVWQIDNSNYAPKMNVLEKPNDWFKEVKKFTDTTDLTPTKKLQFEFWTNFKAYGSDGNISLSFRKVYPQHWYEFSIGRSGAVISLTTNTQTKEIGCELYIHNSNEFFDIIYEDKERIEKALENNIEWMPLPDKKASRIKSVKSFNIENKENWKEAFDWFVEYINKYKELFSNY